MALLRGTVTDNQDPMQRGRCRVFVWGMHSSEDPNLPWAETAGSTMFGLHNGVGYSGVLQVGTTVWVQFEQQDIQCPVIVGVFVGHNADNMGEAGPANSDFNPDAKGDNYGQVWMFNTPAGNSFKMDDKNPRIHITTPNGFELDLDDQNKKIRLGTPCGPEIVMECDKKITISSGCAKMTMDGCKTIIDSDVTVNGHLTAQGLFAPNICYCGKPGDPSKAKPTPVTACKPCDAGKGSSCNTDFPPSAGGISGDMQKLVDEAQKIFKAKTGKEFKICEGKMTGDRYNCLTSGGESVPIQMVCGHGIVASEDGDCEKANASSASPCGETKPGDCGSNFPEVEAIKNLIAKGESASSGGYNAYNRGDGKLAKEKIDFSQMTYDEYFTRAMLPPGDPKRIFAHGKYQFIPPTVKGALSWAKLPGSTKITPETQEKLFPYFFLSARKPTVGAYLLGNGNIDSAMEGMAKEWASIGINKDMQVNGKQLKKGQSYYSGVGNNVAHTPPEPVQKALEDLKALVEKVSNDKKIPKQKALECVLQPAK